MAVKQWSSSKSGGPRLEEQAQLLLGLAHPLAEHVGALAHEEGDRPPVRAAGAGRQRARHQRLARACAGGPNPGYRRELDTLGTASAGRPPAGPPPGQAAPAACASGPAHACRLPAAGASQAVQAPLQSWSWGLHTVHTSLGPCCRVWRARGHLAARRRARRAGASAAGAQRARGTPAARAERRPFSCRDDERPGRGHLRSWGSRARAQRGGGKAAGGRGARASRGLGHGRVRAGRRAAPAAGRPSPSARGCNGPGRPRRRMTRLRPARRRRRRRQAWLPTMPPCRGAGHAYSGWYPASCIACPPAHHTPCQAIRVGCTGVRADRRCRGECHAHSGIYID